jgi:protein transport protein SEC39
VTAGYALAIKLYLKSSHPSLPLERVGEVVLHEAMAAYDSASNGNKTRGAMKKANDMSDFL